MLSSQFKDKLSLMSNRELKDFIRESENVSSEARQAALVEAKGRGIEVDQAPPEIEKPLVVTKVDLDPNDRWGKQQQVVDESAPLLYSKRAIYTFSLIFSVLFGAIMMVLNLRQLKKPEGVVPTISFSVAYLATFILLINYLESHFNFKVPGSNFVSFLGAWLILEIVWNKFIGKEIKYRKRSILMPTIIGILIAAVFFIALFAVDRPV